MSGDEMTTMRISKRNRDELARLAATEYRGATLDEALRSLLFEHETRAAFERLAAEPQALKEYQDEARELAEVDVEVKE
jgi:hypothetical protein